MVEEKRNIIEEFAARYRRRVKKIEEKPDPKRLHSNKLFYQIMADNAEALLKWWREGKPVAFIEDTIPPALIRAMGFFPFSGENRGDAMIREHVPRYLKMARENGFPDNACDRVQMAAAFIMAAERGEVPMFAFSVTTLLDCDQISGVAYWVGRRLKIPFVGIDGPLVINPFEDKWEAIKYMEAQLRDLIRIAEEKVPGIKYDEEKHYEYLQIQKKTEEAQDRVLQGLKFKPCPFAGRDALRMPPLDIADDPRMIDYYNQCAEEMEERAKEGVSPVGKEEKARLMFLSTAPFYMDSFDIFERNGIACPVFEVGPGAFCHPYPRFEDREHLGPFFEEVIKGRKLTLLEYEAARMATDCWAGPVEKRWRNIRDLCLLLEADGIIHFSQFGCATLNGTGRIIAKRAEKELGIPTLEVEAYCQDQERFNVDEYERRAIDFIELVLRNKTKGGTNGTRQQDPREWRGSR